MTAALAIFVKTVGMSPLKTRLAASIGSAPAQQFYQLSTAATAQVVACVKPPIQAYWAVAEASAIDHPNWQAFPTIWQGNGELGARLHRVCAQLQHRHGRVMMIGADAPQITVDLIAQAVDALVNNSANFVLGRACDGGFWLFGTRIPVPQSVWNAVVYSQPATADELGNALAPHGKIVTLPTLSDVDCGEDLIALAGALAALPNPLTQQQRLLEWINRL